MEIVNFIQESLYLSQGKEGVFLLQEDLFLLSLAKFWVTAASIFLSMLYYVTKTFRVFCYTKVALEWIPVINPYVWPASFIAIITDPYFKFWEKMLPPIRFKKGSFHVATFAALELLNAVLFTLKVCVFLLLRYAESFDTILNLNN